MAKLKDKTALERERIRQVGGGRKTAFETIAGLEAAFLRVLEQYTAGSPMDATIKWTNLKRHEISALLQEEGKEALDMLNRTCLLHIVYG
jgi:hypothetical protein